MPSTPDTAATVNVAAEASLLHAVLVDPDVYDELVDKLTADMFVHPLHRAVWTAIVAVDAHGRPLDTLSVADEMRRAGDLDRYGGLDAVEELRRVDQSPDTLADSVNILTDHSIRRRMWSATDTIRRLVADPAIDRFDLVGRAEEAVNSASDTARGDGWQTMAQLAAALQNRMDKKRQQMPGTSTGIDGLDRLIGGLIPGQLVLIGARPGMGKSVLALQLAAHVAETTGSTVPFLSYEMTAEELAFRLVAARSGVDMSRLQRGAVPEGMANRVSQAVGHLVEVPLTIDDNPPRTIGAVRSAVRRLARRGPIGAVVIDYLQLMSSDRRHEGRTQEISEISREAKLLAGELAVPVIACSQLSRQLMARTDKRPQLSDLRESGSLEQDANVVLFLHREHVFDNQAPADAAELIVAKNRNGPAPATIALEWNGPAMRLRERPDVPLPDEWG